MELLFISSMKAFWSNFTVKPEWMERIHLFLTIVWFIMMPIAILFGWIYSLAFISVISIYANFAGHFSSWQASRVERKQDEMTRQEGS